MNETPLPPFESLKKQWEKMKGLTQLNSTQLNSPYHQMRDNLNNAWWWEENMKKKKKKGAGGEESNSKVCKLNQTRHTAGENRIEERRKHDLK